MTPHAPHAAGATGGRRRRAAANGDAVFAAALVAILVHGGVLIGVEVLDLALPGMGSSNSAAAATLPPEELAAAPDPSCDADAILRASARAAWCATPFVDDSGACLEDVEARLRTDFVLCHIDSLEEVPQIVHLSPDAIEKMAQIDPEPLLEPLTPEEQQQFEQKKQEVAQAVPPPPPPAAPPPPALQAQVIETPKPADEVAPDEARFLAEYDMKADEQKVARGSRFEEIADAPKPEELAAKKDPKPANQPEPPEPEIGQKPDAPPLPGALSMRAPGLPDPGPETAKKVAGDRAGAEQPGDGAAAQRGDGAITSQERKPSEVAPGENGGGGGTPRAPNLRPNDETLERLVGGGSVDHVEDVDESDTNQFNAKRWVYASFFNRLKRQVAQNWDPATVWRREDPEGKHYGYKPRITQLRISLDERGRVTKVLVVGPSGVDALDDEAIRAFKAAEPFPNPPDALVDRDGFITFDFGFHFSIEEKKTTWKITRSM
jgi:TonB family protein